MNKLMILSFTLLVSFLVNAQEVPTPPTEAGPSHEVAQTFYFCHDDDTLADGRFFAEYENQFRGTNILNHIIVTKIIDGKNILLLENWNSASPDEYSRAYPLSFELTETEFYNYIKVMSQNPSHQVLAVTVKFGLVDRQEAPKLKYVYTYVSDFKLVADSQIYCSDKSEVITR